MRDPHKSRKPYAPQKSYAPEDVVGRPPANAGSDLYRNYITDHEEHMTVTIPPEANTAAVFESFWADGWGVKNGYPLAAGYRVHLERKVDNG